MFPIYIHDGTSDVPSDDICYIVAKEGVFLKKKIGIMESIAKVQNISILQDIESMAKMNIKKIPGGQFAQVIAFFREVYKQYWGEAIVLLFYDEVRKVYKIVPPHQKVSGGACDYDKGIVIEGMQMIGTIHSHASMSAFHSGTDDHDEEHFDGLHITIGHMRDEEVSISASIVANGTRFMCNPLDYVERLKLTTDIDTIVKQPARRVFRWVNGKMEEDTTASAVGSYNVRKYDKRYQVEVSDRYHKVNQNWMKMVEKKVYVYTSGTYTSGYNIWKGGNKKPGNYGKWGGNYDSSLWGQIASAQTKTTPSAQAPPVKPIEFPPHDVQIEGDENEIPCQTCVFRAHKFLAEHNGLDDEPDVYLCTSCGTTIADDTASELLATCPTCKTDQYMVLLDEEELPNNYVDSEDCSSLEMDNSEIKKGSNFIHCPVCFNHFHMLEIENPCPFCHTDLVYDSEQAIAVTMEIDSGAGMTEATTEEINQAALKEAAKADESIERIPDPNEVAIPLTEKPKGIQERKGFLGTLQRKLKGDK